jgi:hypothetical protein
MDSKYLTLGSGHYVRNNLAKKHVWLSIEIHFGIFYIFGYKPKYSYQIMYECENAPLSHELYKIGLINFPHLIFFQINVICKK